MNPGKKFIVILKEEYDVLKNRTLNMKLVNPEKQDLHKSELEMKTIWEKDLHTDEKIRRFTEELNNMKRKYDNLTNPKPKEATSEKKVQSYQISLEETIIQSLPKTSQTDGLLLLENLKHRPEIITSAATTNRKSNVTILSKTIFTKALSEANVPEKWVKNKEQKKLLQSYKSIKEINPFNTSPVKKKKS